MCWGTPAYQVPLPHHMLHVMLSGPIHLRLVSLLSLVVSTGSTACPIQLQWATASHDSNISQKPSIFCRFFQLLLPHTSMEPNEIWIINSHTLARSTPKLSAKSAHRQPSNCLWHWATKAKNGENCHFLLVFTCCSHIPCCTPTKFKSSVAIP